MHVLRLLPVLVVAQLTRELRALPPTTPVCIACRVDVQQVRSGYSDKDWNALTQGKIVTKEADRSQSGNGVQGDVEASAIVPNPVGQVWSVVIDFRARPAFIPSVKDIRIVRTEGNRTWLAEHIKVLFTNIRFQAINTLEPELGLLTWVLDTSAPHDIADTHGSWQIAALPAGQQTLVRYRAAVDSGRRVPRFIEQFLVKQSLPKVVGGLRSEVRRRFGPRALPSPGRWRER